MYQKESVMKRQMLECQRQSMNVLDNSPVLKQKPQRLYQENGQRLQIDNWINDKLIKIVNPSMI